MRNFRPPPAVPTASDVRPYPDAQAIGVSVVDGVRTVTIKCPLCGHLHTHGWPLGTTSEPGHRVAHCNTKGPRRGYYILGANDAPVSKGRPKQPEPGKDEGGEQ